MRLLVLALVLLAVPMGSARAIDGFELERFCNVDHKMSNGFCLGYVNAVAAVLTTQKVGNFCSTVGEAMVERENLRTKELVEIVKVFFIKWPDARRASAGSVVAAALAEAFPCKTRR